MRNRDGFSLVEVLVALVLLTMIMLGAQVLAGSMMRTAATSNVRMQAMQLAQDRIDLLRIEPRYDSLATKYGGTETSILGHTGFTRVTQLARVQTTTSTGVIDYYRITVRVTAPGLPGPIARTITMAQP